MKKEKILDELMENKSAIDSINFAIENLKKVKSSIAEMEKIVLELIEK